MNEGTEIEMWPGLGRGAPGRPTKLSLDRLRAVLAGIDAGLSQRSAAEAAGIGEQTLLDWRRRGLFELVRVDDLDQDLDVYERIDAYAADWPTDSTWTTVPPDFQPREWPFAVVSVACMVARARYERRLLDLVQQATPRSWQAAAWLLERSMPAAYGRGDSRIRLAIDEAVAASEAKRAPEGDPISVADLERSFQRLEEQTEARRKRNGRG